MTVLASLLVEPCEIPFATDALQLHEAGMVTHGTRPIQVRHMIHPVLVFNVSLAGSIPAGMCVKVGATTSSVLLSALARTFAVVALITVKSARKAQSRLPVMFHR